MITLHLHPESLLTFTIEWWDDGPFWVQMFLPNGDNFHLDRSAKTYDQALTEGLMVCSEYDEWASETEDDIFGGEGSVE